MKNAKTIKSIAAAALALSMFAVPAAPYAGITASAADWTKVDVDSDYEGTTLICEANGFTILNPPTDQGCQAFIGLSDILANPADASKVNSGSWTVTYKGLSSLNGEFGWMGGGAYIYTSVSGKQGINSAGYGLLSDGNRTWSDSVSTTDSFELTSAITDASDSKIIFMDWSGVDLTEKGITITISAFKLFDKDGNEIAQKECSDIIDIEPTPEPTPTPTISYYAVNFTGDYIGSGVTVTGTRTAGSVMTVNVPIGYQADVVCGSNRIAAISDGTGTFVMPAGNVTVNVTSYLGAYVAGYTNSGLGFKNAYIYSYDSEMNRIATNSVKGGMKASEGEVTVKLGKKYAGKTVTLYSGRKSTSKKVDEATLDSNGQATFTVKSGKNYTLVVE